MPRGRRCRLFASLGVTLLAGLCALPAGAQGPAPAAGPPPVSLSALVDQTVALFPEIEGDVVEVQGKSLTLSPGRRAGTRPGLVLEVFREGREIRHPRTGQVLGRAEQPLGRAVVTQVAEGYSLATMDGSGVQPGDRVRASGKVRLTLVALGGPGVRSNLIEAATGEVYEGLNRTGRFQVTLGEQVGAWLQEQKIDPEEFLRGRGVADVSQRLRADHMLVLQYKPVNRRPFIDARLFSAGRADPALTTAFFVPPSVKPAEPGRFSGGDRQQAQQAPRSRQSLLSRLLIGDVGGGAYSTAESSIPLKEVARLGFPVIAMDVSVAPADRVPRIVLTDGERVYLYRLVNHAFEPEWTYYAHTFGRVFSVQLVDLDGDGAFEVAANRFHTRTGMSSFVLGTRGSKPAPLVDQVNAILLAVDDTGAGVKRTLWAQRYRPESFYATGSAEQLVLRNGSLATERAVVVPSTFRATGAAFSNLMGKEARVLVYIDEQQRLRITSGSEELWRSSSVVGSGVPKLEVVRDTERGGRSFFYPVEPVPLSADLDGDGIEEVVVPQNQQESGVLAVAFKGPTGVRFQLVASGFEGVITGLGAIPSEDASAPSLIASVVRYRNILGTGGETKIILTMPE